jgi:hypothetical protein
MFLCDVSITNAEYIKMLRELEDLALVQGNEAPFKALEQAAQSVKTIPHLEHNYTLQQRTIDTFFKPRGVITQESDVESEGGSGCEPVGFYGFGDEDDMDLDGLGLLRYPELINDDINEFMRFLTSFRAVRWQFSLNVNSAYM